MRAAEKIVVQQKSSRWIFILHDRIFFSFCPILQRFFRYHLLSISECVGVDESMRDD